MAFSWAPDLAEVGALLLSRTKSLTNTQELGTFTDDTRPSAEHVQALINRSAREVAGAVQADIPAEFDEDAANLAALRTALWIELSFFPEQIDNGNSPYAEYKVLYTEGLAALAYRVQQETGVDPGNGNGEGPAPGVSGSVSFGFPLDLNPLGSARW